MKTLSKTLTTQGKVEHRHSLDDPTENELDDLLDDTDDSETEDSQIDDIVDGEPTVSSEIKLNHLNSVRY